MPKRPNPKALKGVYAYTVPEAAETLSVTPGAIRLWLKQGLPSMTSKRPTLILGENLREFLQARRAKSKVRMALDEFYCLGCKQAQKPLGMMADAIPQQAGNTRLVGLCPACGHVCNRMIRTTDLLSLGRIFDIAVLDRPVTSVHPEGFAPFDEAILGLSAATRVHAPKGYPAAPL